VRRDDEDVVVAGRQAGRSCTSIVRRRGRWRLVVHDCGVRNVARSVWSSCFDRGCRSDVLTIMIANTQHRELKTRFFGVVKLD